MTLGPKCVNLIFFCHNNPGATETSPHLEFEKWLSPKELIIDAVFRQCDMSRKDARMAVEGLLSLVKKTLAGEEDVLISGFGKFIVKRKDARLGGNPHTKEAMKLRHRRVVVFHTSGILRQKINGEEMDASTGDD